MTTGICQGLRANSVPPASSTAFQQLCQITTGTNSTVTADTLFGMARSLIASSGQAAPAAALQHLFGPLDVELFARAASEYSSFGELARTDPARAASLNAIATSVNTHFGGLYQGKSECLRSTMCAPQWGLDHAAACAACRAIRCDDTFMQRLRRKVTALAQPDRKLVASGRRKDTMSLDEQLELGKQMKAQKKAQQQVSGRAAYALQRLRTKFESTIEAAKRAVSQWRESTTTRFSDVLAAAQAKDAELQELQQTVAEQEQQLVREREKMASASAAQLEAVTSSLARERGQMAQQLAGASADEQVRREALRSTALSDRTKQLQILKQQHERELVQLERTLKQEFEAQLERVEHQQSTDLSSFPEYIQNLIRAEKLGHAQQHPACIDILKGIAVCLSKNSTTARRELNETEKQLYAILLNSQSPWAVKFVSHNLLGPNVRTIQKLRSLRSPEIAMEVSLAAVRDILVPLVTEHKLFEYPGGCCEDGTTANRKLDWELEPQSQQQVDANGNEAATNAAPERPALEAEADADDVAREEALARLGEMPAHLWRRGLKVWGLSGGPVVVYSKQQLLALFDGKTRAIARYVYVYTWVVTAKHAPWFPFIMLATDNKFKAEWNWRMWRRLHSAFKTVGLKMTWHASDGDCRMRLCDFVMNAFVNRDRNGDWCTGSAFRLTHPLMLLHVPRTKEGFALLAGQDLVHTLWRWRRQVLNPSTARTHRSLRPQPLTPRLLNASNPHP